MKYNISVSNNAELTGFIRDMSGDINTLAITIRPVTTNGIGVKSDTEAYPDLPIRPEVSNLELTIEGSRSDYTVEGLRVILNSLSSFANITELTVSLNSDGPSINGLPAFVMLDTLILDTVRHPLDGLPVFPSLEDIDTTGTLYCAESEKALLNTYPDLWLNPDFYTHKDRKFGVKCLLRNWPDDKKIPICVRDKDCVIYSFLISKDLVYFQGADETTQFKRGEYSRLVCPGWSRDFDLDLSERITYLDIEDTHLNRLIINETGVFLEYSLLEIGGWSYDNDGPSWTGEYAYLPVGSYEDCFYWDRRANKEGRQFVFYLEPTENG